MTVQTTTSRADYTGNGTTTAFAVPFYFLDSSHITVLRTQISTGAITTLAITTDYSVTGAGVPAGGTITCVTAPTSDQKLSILRNVPLTQLVDYVANDPFPAETHERALDQLTMEVQQINEIAGRALTLPANTAAGTVSASLPTPSASNLIGWNPTGTGLQNVNPGTLATIVAYGTARADLFNGTGSQTAFTLTQNPAALANLDVSVGGVTQRPGVDFLWSSGTTLTFTTAPPVGTNTILVRYLQGLPLGTADSSSVTFQPAGTTNLRTAQDKLRESVSVKDFGATGDGTTNDAAAIQAAITATVATGGLLVFNPGIYELGTSSLNVTGGCQISGLGATLRRSGDAITPVLNVTGSNVSVSNLVIASTFAGAPTADANNCALLFNGGANVYAENVSVSGRFYIGIELASVNGGVVSDCKVKGVRNRGIYVYLNWSDISLTNCVIDGAETGTTPYCDYGVNFNPGGTFQPSRSTVTGCLVTNCTSQGIAVSERSLYTSISNCVVQNIPSGYGFLVQRANGFDGLGALISNCYASSCQTGFYVSQSFYVDIVGCHALLNTNDGIQINDSQYIGVTGCVARNNTQNGIYVFASGASLASRITLTGNRSVANGGTGIISNANCYGLAVSTNIAIANTTAQINILGTANQVGNGANIVV